MEEYEANSGIRISEVRVSNFRSIQDVEIHLENMTVLLGANNAGKTSFLDALYTAIGSGKRFVAQSDIHLEPNESVPPQSRRALVDIKFRPVDDAGNFLDVFPQGSFWTQLWGPGIVQDLAIAQEFVGLRASLFWSPKRSEYIVERHFLKQWNPNATWTSAGVQESRVSSLQIEPISLHYIDAKRDFEDDLMNHGSFWRKLTDDLGMSDSEIAEVEKDLAELNQKVIDGSEVLKHLAENLGDVHSVVSADSAGIDISPIAPHFRDLSKGVNVSFATQGGQSFPLTGHGMGTRSLASLLVFRAFATWRIIQAEKAKSVIHSVLALEEPESHLHPQAQRSMFAQVQGIPGQRIISTHSPYLVGQAKLSELRLFAKKGGNTTVSKLNFESLDADEVRVIEDVVIASRGDLLFSRAVVFFEGQTEEQALPIWARQYWAADIHELGFCFVRVNGTNYYPYLLLAEELKIPWYVLGDGESKAIKELTSAVKKIGRQDLAACPNIFLQPKDSNFEKQIIAEGYLWEVEAALDEVHVTTNFLNQFIVDMEGSQRSKTEIRTYKGKNGREIAALDALVLEKTRVAKPLASIISKHSDPKRRFPSKVNDLYDYISKDHLQPKAVQK